MALSAALTTEKAMRRRALILKIVEDGLTDKASPGYLIARLAFARTAFFGRFDRDIRKPLYAKLYPHPTAPLLLRSFARGGTQSPLVGVGMGRSTAMGRFQRPRASRLGPLYGRRLRPCPMRMPEWGRFAPGWHAGRPGDRWRNSNNSPFPGERGFRRPSAIIFGRELSAVAPSIFPHRYRLRGGAVTACVDNGASSAALINGDPPLLGAAFWSRRSLSLVYRCDAWHRNLA